MFHGTRQDPRQPRDLQKQVMDSAQRQPFDLAGHGEFGYHRRQVDDFMARARASYEGGGTLRSSDIRHTTFDAVRGGYAAEQVDDVLDRLEDALAQAERERRIEAEGEEAWSARVQESVRVLRGRLDRPDGERFRRGEARAASYDLAGVDGLCRRLAARFAPRPPAGRPVTGAAGSGDAGRLDAAHLDADELRRVVFGPAVGAAGYDEAQVDAFLDAAIDVLTVLD
jgi:DivIVA domain-containing protein